MCVCECVSMVSAYTCNKVANKRYLCLQRNMGYTFMMVLSLIVHTYNNYVIYMFACICIYTYIHVCICVCVCVLCACNCVYTFVCIYVCVCLCFCLCVLMYVCVWL